LPSHRPESMIVEMDGGLRHWRRRSCEFGAGCDEIDESALFRRWKTFREVPGSGGAAKIPSRASVEQQRDVEARAQIVWGKG